MSQPWFEPSDADDASGGGTPPPRRPRRPAKAGSRPSGPLVPTILILIALLSAASYVARLWTDLLWYDSVGYRNVFTTQLGTQIMLFVLGLLVTAALVWSSLYLGHRSRPLRIPMTPAQHALEQYRRAVEPLRRIGMVVVPILLGLLGASTLSSQWKTYLLWANGRDFGTKDPQFGRDLGFFVFDVPFIQLVIGFLTMALVLAIVAAVVTHYLYGGLQLPGRGPTTRAAFVHIGVLGAALFLVRGASYWFGRYAMASKDSSLLTGIKYTDDHAVLPTKAILAVAAVICALLFLAAIWTRTWRLPIVAVALLTVLAVVVGGIYPSLVQSLKVKPSEKSLESPYIQRNIDATRDAYGLSNVKVTAYNAITDAAPGQLRTDAETIPGVRLIDPNLVSPTFRQFEGLRQYYAFPDTLDVDRYAIDGRTQDSVVAVREINLAGVPDAQRNWLNDHTVYTHGFGFIAAYGNRRTSEGDPVFFSTGFGTKGPNGKEYQPRIYFGEQTEAYAIVGSAGTALEFDYPDDSATGGQRTNRYGGTGGVRVDSLFRKLAYAIKYREPKFVLSNAVGDGARILDYRTPKERVERVAPWLTLDGNVYPAVVDGRVKWIVDGYTTSAAYPNSRLVDVADATSDSVTEQSSVVSSFASGKINYVRNSVKATVDAYDGSVTMYAWDAKDPILQAWASAFGNSVRPVSEISGDLMSHLRYPQDLLKIQRLTLARYHVTQADSFFGGGDFWKVPKDPTHDTQDLPPYFQSLAMPDQASPTFSITSPFVPTGAGREILRGFLAADADAGTQAGKPSEDYGNLRLLELPRNSSVDGPGQVQNQIEISTARSQSPTEPLNLSQFIAQNRQTGKALTFGNLLTLPVGGGLLYVQPMYVQATKESGSFPQNKATVAVFGKRIAWGETLKQALDGLFGGDSGTDTGEDGGNDGGGTTPPPTTGGTGSTAALAAAVARAQTAYDQGQAALKAGNFAAYGEAQKRLSAALTEIERLLPKSPTTPTTKPTPAATATATGTPAN